MGSGGEPPQILVNSKCAAAMLSISERKLWELKTSGAIPSVRIDGAVRFRVSDIEAWIAAGCPTTPQAKKRAG
jgi:predicted DNA-binding transcriptional regulator AlpA